MYEPTTRRTFLKNAAFGAAALGLASCNNSYEQPPIPGFNEGKANELNSKPWVPVSDRKIRLGIAGYGHCKFGADFSFQHHPNVEVVAVSDLLPDRCQALAEDCKCRKTFPSLEEMVKDDSIEAIFVATDAPSHCRHSIEVLKHGKHVASAVPAVFGSLEEADQLFEAVTKSDRIYMMFETSCFRRDNYAMRSVYQVGGFGKLVYSEGEYYHFGVPQMPSYKNWRDGIPPQWYPTHANAYYVGVTGGSFTEVSCLGMPSSLEKFQPKNNVYQNPFATEVAMYRTNDGGLARMVVSWDTAGGDCEVGRVRGEKGSMSGTEYNGIVIRRTNINRPPLPPGVQPGGDGESHGYLAHEFVMSILENRRPLVDIARALNMTVSGIVAHQSALKTGETMKIPQYSLSPKQSEA